MKTRNLLTLLILTAAVGFGAGTLSEHLTARIFYECQNRALRNLVNRDLLADLSPAAAYYFQGKADGLLEAADLINRAVDTGTTDPLPLLPPPPPPSPQL